MSSQESIYLSKIPLQFSSKQTHSLEILITLVFLACSPHLIQNQPTTCDSPFKHSSSWLVSQPLHSPKLIRAHPQPQVLDVSPMATTVRSHPPIDWHIVPFTFQPSTVHCTVISTTVGTNKKQGTAMVPTQLVYRFNPRLHSPQSPQLHRPRSQALLRQRRKITTTTITTKMSTRTHLEPAL